LYVDLGGNARDVGLLLNPRVTGACGGGFFVVVVVNDDVDTDGGGGSNVVANIDDTSPLEGERRSPICTSLRVSASISS
jgi:hypothetical protein